MGDSYQVHDQEGCYFLTFQGRNSNKEDGYSTFLFPSLFTPREAAHELL